MKARDCPWAEWHRRKYLRDLRALRAWLMPTDGKPVRVRWYRWRHDREYMGLTRKTRRGYIIYLNPRLAWDAARLILCHEWAHVLAWASTDDEEYEQHGAEWGAAASRVELLIDRITAEEDKEWGAMFADEEDAEIIERNRRELEAGEIGASMTTPYTDEALAEPANEAQLAAMAQAEMQKAVNCLALELPESVHADVVKRWDELECAMREYLAALQQENARLREAAQEIINYTETGAPDFPEWEAKYDALKQALAGGEKET